FWEQDNVEYTATTDPGHAITYTEDQLKRHSWAFWFRQTDHNARTGVQRFINSRLIEDSALTWQKRGAAISTTSPYNRDNTANYRTPAANFLPEFVPLMRKGARSTLGIITIDVYLQRLNSPIGLTSVSEDILLNAQTFGWQRGEHSDMKDKPLYSIYPWFDKVFANSAQIIL
ncbi:MAG: hypothetical protein LBM70_09560, partial [Victivallales bacterium]|nr:hypothetical protein [Victivallales bacterium]